MVGSPRIDWSPIAVIIEEATTRSKVVFGGRLRVFPFGPQPAVTPGPVELVFSAEYLTRAYKGEVLAVGKFATLRGELMLTDNGVEIHVKADDGLPIEQQGEIADVEHPVVGKLPPLSLTVELGTGFVVLPGEVNEEAKQDELPVRGRLLLPPPDKPSKYLELMVSLERDGVELAPARVNGRLDVSLLSLDFLVFTVADEQGKVAPDVDVELELTNGDKIVGKTDQDGRFALNGVPKGECGVLLPLGIHVTENQQSQSSTAS